MTRFLLAIFIGLAISCTQQEKNNTKVELVEQFDYKIEIDFWNGLSGYESKYILDNSQINTYDSTDSRFNLMKPFNLYYIFKKKIFNYSRLDNSKNIAFDTIQSLLTKKQCSKLFNLTRAFFKSVKLDNYDTSVNGTITKSAYLDATHGSIKLISNDIELMAEMNSTHNPAIATKEFISLLVFIDTLTLKKK